MGRGTPMSEQVLSAAVRAARTDGECPRRDAARDLHHLAARSDSLLARSYACGRVARAADSLSVRVRQRAELDLAGQYRWVRWPGSSLQYVQFIFPGIIGMSVLFTSIFGAMSIVWDREFGFLKEVLVAPIHRSAVAIGKTLGAQVRRCSKGSSSWCLLRSSA